MILAHRFRRIEFIEIIGGENVGMKSPPPISWIIHNTDMVSIMMDGGFSVRAHGFHHEG